MLRVPKFKTEDQEAKWWASREGRAFLKQQSTGKAQKEQHGSPLVAKCTVSEVRLLISLRTLPDGRGSDRSRAR